MASQVKAREFNARGIARARKFLDEVRRNPTVHKGPPHELLVGPEYTRPFRGQLTVDRRWHAFGSRREIGEYLALRLNPFRTRIADRTSFWSWLGMFHFEDTVRIVDGAVRLSPLDETFVIDRRDTQNLRGIHRHYLRAAWQLYEVHGEAAAFLLDQRPWARGDIADRIFQSQRIFNSTGIVPLILGLYTDGNRPKRGFQARPGGLRHLLRVLDQLERTHDVYGMSPEAMIRILPPEFEPWVNGTEFTIDTPSDPGSREPEGAAERDQPDRASPPEEDASRPDPDDVGPPDPKLQRWEETVRKNGHGTIRYNGFRATVGIDEATGALLGTIVNPESCPIGTVSAAGATEFKGLMKSQVNEYLTRGRG